MPSLKHQTPTSLSFSLAIKELLSAKLFAVSFIINLSLGLIGFILVTTLSTGLGNYLDHGSKRMLGGDLAVSGARPITEGEVTAIQDLLPPNARLRHEVTMLTMSALKNKSRLIEVKAIDNLFPFYGELKLEHHLTTDNQNVFVNSDAAYLSPDLKVQLSANIADTIKIGDLGLKVNDFVVNDPTVSGFGFQIAPRVYIPLQALAKTGLLNRGSRAQYTLVAELPPGVDVGVYEEKLRQFVDQKAQAAESLSLRVKSSRQSAADMGRVLAYLDDYLGLVALVATFLSGIGGTYLFRSYLGKKHRDIAVFLSIGLTVNRVTIIYLYQLLLMAAGAAIFASVLTSLSIPLFKTFLTSLLPSDLVLTVSPLVYGQAFLLATVGSLILSLPLLRGIRTVNPQLLLREGQDAVLPPPQQQWLFWLPAVLFYWLLSMMQAHSIQIGSLFFGSFLVAAAVLYGFGWVFVRVVEKALAMLEFHGLWPLVLSGLALSRRRVSTLMGFIAIALGALLMCLVPILREMIASDLRVDSKQAIPSLFLFDILDEEVDELQSLVTGKNGELRYLSPLIRAQLAHVNGTPVKEWLKETPVTTRESEEAKRAVLRGYNLTYRGALSPSEALMAGRPFSSAVTDPPEISLEYRFAERLGFKIGDVLKFQVEGVEVTGKVVSTRKIQWTSFAPNFFVQFQPGVFEDAPKTFVATIFGLPSSGRQEVQSEIVSKFPHISVVDVHEAAGRILGLVEQMSQALVIMAVLSQLAGITVVFAIAVFQADQRTYEVQVLRTIGARKWGVLTSFLAEFSLLGWISGVIGSVLAIAMAYTFSYFVFEKLWSFSWIIPLRVVTVTTIVVAAAGGLVGGVTLTRSPLKLLRTGAA